jgi:hypothetical protein
MRMTILAMVAVLITTAGLVFTESTAAHNIDVKAAREKARDYARAKRSDAGRTYKHYSTDCAAAYPGHNHYVRCTISYQNEADTARGRQTCTERIEVYLKAHLKTILEGTTHMDPTMYVKHTSDRQC